MENNKGVFFNVEQCYHDNKPTGLRFLGRWADKSKMDFVVSGKLPYFYILKEEVHKISFDCKKEYGFKSLYGEELIKLSVENPYDIFKFKSCFTKTFEADLSYPIRNLIDLELYNGISITNGKISPDEIEVDPRVMVVDIETDYSGGSNADMMRPIISIAFHDSYTNKLYCTAIESKEKTFNKKYKSIRPELKLDTEVELFVVKNESDLLTKFKQYVLEMDFDIFTGWNVNFDMIYILHRMQCLNLGPESLSPIGKIFYRSGNISNKEIKNSNEKQKKSVFIKGRAIIDLMAGYKRMKWKSIPSFRLEVVGQSEFNSGKVKYKGWIHDFWINNFDSFIEYNIKDVEICMALNKKYNILNSLLGVKKMSGALLSDMLQNSRIIDVYILRHCRNKFVLPTKEMSDSIDKIEGGFVLEPRPGVSKNIVVLDLKSLYPSIMLSFNMSPETISENGEISVGNGVKFKKEQGILTAILLDVLKKRDEVRALLKTPEYDKEKFPEKYLTMYKKQYYYKTFQNSFYGTTLFPGFRLFNPAIGSSITYIGRYVNEKMRTLCLEKGFEVIGADTDSIIVDVHEKDSQKAIEIGKALEVEINNSFGRWFEEAKNHLEYFIIKFEKLYSIYCNAGGKKCYAGKIIWDWEKGLLDIPDLEIKGFATVKSDRSVLSRKIQKFVLEAILEEKPTEEIIIYIKAQINAFLKGEFLYEQIGIPKAISKDLDEYKIKNPWIRGVEYSLKNINGFTFSPKPYLIYVKPTQERNIDCMCFNNEDEVPKDILLDKEEMIEKSILKVVEKPLEIINYDVKLLRQFLNLKLNHQQTLF